MADQYDGQGGSYVVENGAKRKVHNTNDHPQGNRPREAEMHDSQTTAAYMEVSNDASDA